MIGLSVLAGCKPQFLIEYGQNKQDAVIVTVHGGGFHSYTHKNIEHYSLFFAQNGYKVYSVNYTLNDPQQAIKDVARAVKQVKAMHPHKRVIVGGTSAGGHLAASVYVLSGVEVDGLFIIRGVINMQEYDGRHSSMDIDILTNVDSAAPRSILIYGDSDPATSVNSVINYCEIVTDCEYHLFTGQDHFFDEEHKEQAKQLLTGWLNGN